jgi:hypothetical protein
MTVRFRVSRGDDVREFEFDRQAVTIGRGPLNDVVLDCTCVARRHGTLSSDPTGRLTWICPASGCPTTLERAGGTVARTEGEGETRWELHCGDVVRLGDDDVSAIVEIIDCQPATTEPIVIPFGTASIDTGAAAVLNDVAWGLAREPDPGVVLHGFERLLHAVNVPTGSSTLVAFSGADDFRNHAWVLEPGGGYCPGPDPIIAMGTAGQTAVSRWRADRSIVVLDEVILIPFGTNSVDAVIVNRRPESVPPGVLSAIADVARWLEPYVEMFIARRDLEREHSAIVEENRYFRERQREHYLYKELVCESDAMQQVHSDVKRHAATCDPVLITGEAGTGKELLARFLHHSGQHSHEMFLRVGCASYPDESANRELFGETASATAPGLGPRKGVFELARQGTVFLEEIDRLAPMVQAKLCRALKECEVRRVGESIGRPIRARLVASIHRDLSEAVSEGRLRRDLYLLLKKQTIAVPALRNRPEDILPLARNFLAVYADRYGRAAKGFTDAAEARLAAHSWPGNVRELQSRVESGVLGTSGSLLKPSHLGLSDGQS